MRPAILALLVPLFVACAAGVARTPEREPAQTPDWGGSAVSDRGRLKGRLYPESGSIEINRFQSWILELRDTGGTAVAGAQIAIAGGMPSHGHGLPTEPRVTEELGDGRYRIEGVKLNMVGAWVIEIFVQTAAGQDRLRFDLAIDY